MRNDHYNKAQRNAICSVQPQHSSISKQIQSSVQLQSQPVDSNNDFTSYSKWNNLAQTTKTKFIILIANNTIIQQRLLNLRAYLIMFRYIVCMHPTKNVIKFPMHGFAR